MTKRQVALVWAVSLVVLAVGCKGCAGREEPAVEGVEDEEDVEANAASIDWLVPNIFTVSPMDERFFSIVAFDPVSALNLKQFNHHQGCNGVLVASNLVLTSAHCVCAPSHGEPGRFDGSGCAAKVTVRVDYADPSVGDGGRTEWTDKIAGDILVHPRFQLVLDSQGAVATSRADLAVIRLERSASPRVKPARLATEDVKVGEGLDVVGVGFTNAGHIGRWTGEAKVQAPAGEDRVRLSFQHDDDYMGEPGSPWVRQTKQEFELVGISQCGLGLTPTLTRIAPYREWLEEQIRAASGKH